MCEESSVNGFEGLVHNEYGSEESLTTSDPWAPPEISAIYKILVSDRCRDGNLHLLARATAMVETVYAKAKCVLPF